MKILVVGDQHFRYELPYASAFKDGRRKEWENVKKTILQAAKSCDAVVLLGDNFNARHNHSSVIKEFVDFLNGFGDKEVHILSGNHERYGTSTAVDFLKGIKAKKWHVYTEPTKTEVAGQPAVMIPFVTPAILEVETKEEAAQKIIDFFPKDAWPLAFCHHGITESKIHGKVIDFMNEIVLPKKMMEQHFAHVFVGHIHGKQNIFPSIYVTGNVFSHEVGDYEKSIWTYESNGTIDVEIKEIPLPVRSIYKIIWEERNPQALLNTNSIVKCYVTDRNTNLDDVREYLKDFDASIVVEQYPSERAKVHFENGVMDLSVETMLKHYAEAKKLSYSDIIDGFELIKK